MNLLPFRSRRAEPGRHAPRVFTDTRGGTWTVVPRPPAAPAPAPWELQDGLPEPAAALDDGAWWGMTAMDIPPARDRRYVPDPLGQFPPAGVPDPGPQADLGALVIFRDTVRAVFVRQEEARGFSAPDIPWHVRYAGLYRARTGQPAMTGFGIAGAARQAHEEAQAAVPAGVNGDAR